MEENFMDQLSFDQVKELMFLSKSYPNNMEFGKNCRSLLPTIEVNKNYPNDEVLGKYMRKSLKRFER